MKKKYKSFDELGFGDLYIDVDGEYYPDSNIRQIINKLSNKVRVRKNINSHRKKNDLNLFNVVVPNNKSINKLKKLH